MTPLPTMVKHGGQQTSFQKIRFSLATIKGFRIMPHIVMFATTNFCLLQIGPTVSQSINQSVNQSINQSISHSNNQSRDQSIIRLINRVMNESNNQVINQFID